MNKVTLLLFLSIVPILLILVIVYNKDKNKESLFHLIRLFILGIVSCFLVMFISTEMRYVFPFMQKKIVDMDFFNLFLYAFVGVALVEEFCKWIMVYFHGYRNRGFDELYDIIVYSVFVSLGFAFYENLKYVFILNSVKTAFLRGICSIPGHACDAIFMGYYLSLAKQFQIQKKKDLEQYYLCLSVMIPALLHGIYDFCLLSGYFILIVVFILFVGYLYWISIRKIKYISNNNQKVIHQRKFCSSCGAKLNENNCPRCGNGHSLHK